jgi:response regulator NasT
LISPTTNHQPLKEYAMTQSLRIVVADDEPVMRKYYQKILPVLGHEVVGIAETGRELVEKCKSARPDVVITDIQMPELDGIEAATQIYKECAVPVILVSAFHDPELIERAEHNHIFGYLVKPIKQADLGPVIALTMRRFEQFQALRREADDLRQALEDRKHIEKAKGILMRRLSLDEEQAFRRLQKLASDKNLKLIEAARALLLAEEAFNSPG